MFIITDKDPDKAVKFLVEHTSKTFYFKQLIELAQLICSAGFSDTYKKVNRGKEIQEWIRENKWFTSQYFRRLWYYCMANTNIKPKTSLKVSEILRGLEDSIDHKHDCFQPIDCIFRYKKGYETKIPTNSRLQIDEGCRQYKIYITKWKFRKENVKEQEKV